MANAAEVVLWYEQQRYKALDKALKAEGTTVEKELEKSLDVLYARLVPETERAAIEKNLAQEEERMAALRARQKAESYRVSALLLYGTHSGCWKLKRAWEVFDLARFLRTALRQSEQTVEQSFWAQLGEVEPLSEDAFTAMKCARADFDRHVNGVFLVDLRSQKFYLVKPGEGWEIYRFKDISGAAFRAAQKRSAEKQELRERFLTELENRKHETSGI